jgi:DNA-binding transcriptional ArsR family regulator
MPSRKKAKKSTSKKGGARRPRVKQRAGGARPSDRPREIAVFDPDAVESVLDVLPDEDQLQMAADRLSGLGHPSRLRALIALSVAELCVGDIAAIVGLSLSATSTMLKQLRSLGFLATRSAGKQTYYRLASAIPGALMESAFAEEATDDEG